MSISDITGHFFGQEVQGQTNLSFFFCLFVLYSGSNDKKKKKKKS